jgi:hypothetical protein
VLSCTPLRKICELKYQDKFVLLDFWELQNIVDHSE